MGLGRGEVDGNVFEYFRKMLREWYIGDIFLIHWKIWLPYIPLWRAALSDIYYLKE